MIAYKIMTASEHAAFQATGVFPGSPVDLADGFIHLSTADQVAETLARHFAGQTGLILATIDLDALGDTVRWEPSRGGQLFPHVHGHLPMSAVLSSTAIPLATSKVA